MSVFDLPRDIKYSLLQGDVTEQITISLVAEASAVIHLAGITEPTASVSDPEWLYGNNLRITQHVVDACSHTGTPLIFVSTTSVYTSNLNVVDESCTQLAPISPYAKCKLEEEDYIRSSLDPETFTIFRLGTIFGVSPGMRFHTAVNKFCWQAATGQPLGIWSTAMDQYRPYLAVSDATAILSKTVLNGIYQGDIINAVSCDATVREVIAAISEYGLVVDINLIDSEIMNNLSFQTSVSKALALGYAFQGDLRNGVFETLDLLGDLAPNTQEGTF